MDFISTQHHDTYPFIAQATHHNHKVLITGASRGIGLATAHSFARAGAPSIAIAARGPLDTVETALLSTAKEAGHPPPTILKLTLDVADDASVAAAAEEVAAKFGHLDILINNAGTSEPWVPIAEKRPGGLVGMLGSQCQGRVPGHAGVHPAAAEGDAKDDCECQLGRGAVGSAGGVGVSDG
ncbi:hypothetical protein V6Z79_009743 [Aspergillus fumigatus]